MVKEEMLIECVKRYPELYDHQNPLYSVIGKKTTIWEAIAQELGESASACKSRWNSMRDAYRKSENRNVVRLQQGERIKLYKYSQSLAFLKKFIKLTKDGYETEDEVESEEDESELLEEIVPSKRQKVEEETEKIVSHGYLEYYPEVSSETSYVVPALEGQQGQTSTMDTFLACIGATLKSLPPEYASLAKADIFACVQKYELRAITDQNRGGPSSSVRRVPVVSASSSEAAGNHLDPLNSQ